MKGNIEVASYFVSQDGEQETEQLQLSVSCHRAQVRSLEAVPANCSGNTAEMFPPQLSPDQMTQLFPDLMTQLFPDPMTQLYSQRPRKILSV